MTARPFREHPALLPLKRMLGLPGALLARWRNRQSVFRHELAVCAIFKEEARYLDEWLTFHSAVGIEHFYLYDNGSTDDFHAVLQPWIGRGMVTLTAIPGKARQRPAYRDCIRRFRREARWIAFIDIDEFLFSPQRRDLREVLSAYRDLPALFVYWHMFGSSGHVSRPPGPVIEAYTRRQEHPSRHRNGKAVVNPRVVRRMDVHSARAWLGEILDENRRPPPHGPRKEMAVASREIIRINHYWSRSLEDLRLKAERGRASTGAERDLAHHREVEKKLNDVEDLTIQPLWAAIRADPAPPPRKN